MRADQRQAVSLMYQLLPYMKKNAAIDLPEVMYPYWKEEKSLEQQMAELKERAKGKRKFRRRRKKKDMDVIDG